MKKDNYESYGGIEDTSAYFAGDDNYIDSYQKSTPRWIVLLVAVIVVLAGVFFALLVMRQNNSRNVEKYTESAGNELIREEIEEQKRLESLNIMNSKNQPWFSGDGNGTLYFHSEKFSGKKLTIPAAFDGTYIKKLGDGFNIKNDTVQELYISNGVEELGVNAFKNFTSLKKVEIPDSLIYIGGGSFKNTPWYDNLDSEFCIIGNGTLIKYCGNDEKIQLPEKVKIIDGAVFENFDGAKEIVIPESVVYIGDSAFKNCTAVVSGGSSVKHIANNAFFGSATVENANGFLTMGKGCMIAYKIENGEIYIPDSVRQISGINFSELDERITLHIGKNVSKIADVAEIGYVKAFKVDENNKKLAAYNGALYSVDRKMIYRYPVYKTTEIFKAEEILQAVGDKTFYGCDIKQIIFYNGIKTVGDKAFYNCKKLKGIDIPDTVISIGNEVFYGCEKLETAHISNEVRVIPNRAFAGCRSLKELVISDKATNICAFAFEECEQLTRFTIPDTLKVLIYNAFPKSTELAEQENIYYKIVDGKAIRN